MTECVIEIIMQWQMAMYYKSLSVGWLRPRLLWHSRSFVDASVSGASRRLSSSSVVAKRSDPRAEFATAWQQPMPLHCCLQSETWCLKKMLQVFGKTD